MLRLTPIILSLVSLLHAGTGKLLVRTWQSADGLPGNVVLALGQTPNRYLWVATTEGVTRFDGHEFFHITMPEDFLAQRLRFGKLFTTPGGSVWLTTTSGLLYRVEGGRLVAVDFPGRDDTKMQPQAGFVKHGHEGYLRNADDLYRLGEGGLEPVRNPNPELLEIQEAGQQEIPPVFHALFRENSFPRLMGNPDEKQRWALILAEGANPIPVNAQLADAEGNLWLATTGHGLIRLKPAAVQYLDEKMGRSLPVARAALRDGDGKWWLAYLSGGIGSISPGGVLVEHTLPGTDGAEIVVGLHLDSRGVIRSLTESGRVFVRDGKSFTEMEVPPLSKVQVISEDGKGRLVLGGSEGVFMLGDDGFTDLCKPVGLANIRPTVISRHSRGGLLIGTRDGRVILLNREKYTHLGKADDFSQSWVSGISEAPDGHIWASTLGSGLFQWKNGQWLRHSRENGLPDDRLTALHINGNGDFWCGSLSGILRISRRDLIGGLTTGTVWQTYNQIDGMRTRECIGTSQPSYWEDGDGTLWFPTASGVAGIAPGSPALVPAPAPPVYLRKIILNDKVEAPEMTSHYTGPGASRLEFHFSAINMKSPDKVSYRVRLLGHEEEPRLVTTPPQVTYGSVPPGIYELEVTAINGDGIPSARPLSVPVTITPHFWQTTWFAAVSILGSLVVAVFIGGLFVRRRTRRKIANLRLSNALEMERTRIARDLHDDIGANLTELSIIASLAAEGNGPAVPQEVFDKMAVKARKVVIALDEIVWAVSPQEDTLPSLIEYLDAYGEEFIGNAGLIYRSELPHSVPSIPIGPRRRHHLCMATREALNNAVKHSGATEISLRASLGEEDLVLYIRDNGRGFDPVAGPFGDGLPNLRERMTKCGGAFSVSAGTGGGTCVTLSIPLSQPIGTP